MTKGTNELRYTPGRGMGCVNCPNRIDLDAVLLRYYPRKPNGMSAGVVEDYYCEECEFNGALSLAVVSVEERHGEVLDCRR